MFHLRALGGLLLESDSAPLTGSARQRRRLTLLVVLARAGELGVSRDKLLALLWPESTQDSARHALDQLLYATRRDLGKQVILSEGGHLRLNAELVWSDVAEFEARLDCGEWESAVQLYGGPFLDGIHLGDSVELERWADAERARLEARLLEALEHLARIASKQGNTQAAVSWWRRRVAAEPLSGVAALGLLQALARIGDRAGALRYAHTYAALLREELGTEPGPEFQALMERVSDEPARAVSATAVIKPAETSDAPAPIATSLPVRSSAEHDTPHRAPRRAMATLFGCAVLLIGAWWMRQTGRSAEAAPPIVPAAQPHTAVPTIAVLPFVDMSPSRDQEYFADGIAEELINALSKLDGLHVVARTSAFSFKGRTADVREIGARLGARTLLQGSIRRSGDHLRISVQLINAEKGYELWSETFDRKMGDVFAVQEEISRAVLRTLQPALLRGSSVPLVAPSTGNAAAYQLYMQGRYLWNQRTEEGLRKAIERFEQAINLDPGYALAYTGVSDAHNALTDNGYVPVEPALSHAEAAARTALKLDPELAEAHTSLGHLRLHRWDWAGADQALRRSIELNPGYAPAYQWYAYLLAFHGRFHEALPLIRRAQHLDPLSPAIQSNYGEILLLARRYPEAVKQLQFTLQMDSTRQGTRRLLANALTGLGRYDEAAVELQRLIAASGGWHRAAVPELGYTYARAGRRAEAEQVRAAIERARGEGKPLTPYPYAELLSALGRPGEAFAMLDEALETQASGLVTVAINPAMDPLRSDPRFAAFLRRLGFTD